MLKNKEELLQAGVEFLAVQQGLKEMVKEFKQAAINIEFVHKGYAVYCMAGDTKVGKIYYEPLEQGYYFEAYDEMFETNPVLKLNDSTIHHVLLFLMSESLLI